MQSVVKNLKIYNSISGKKEIFSSVIDNHVGMYVCGPTVYSNVKKQKKKPRNKRTQKD
jgi:hypothetical protein